MGVDMGQFEKIVSKCVLVLCGMLFAGLFVCGLAVTAVSNMDLSEEHLVLRYDSIVWNLLGLTAALILWVGIYRLICRFYRENRYQTILIIGTVAAFIYSVYWVYSTKTVPQADQLTICEFADAFNAGDYTGLRKGYYVSEQRHQLGIITFLRILFKLFGASNYKALQYLNAFLASGIVYLGAKYAEELTRDKRMGLMTLVLELVCVPLFFYTPFVYGEIISVFCMIASLYLFTKAVRKFCWRTAVGAGLVVGFGVWVRNNTVIVLIAMVLFLLYKFLSGPKGKWVILAAVLIAGTMLFQVGTGILYKNHIPEDAAGIPSIAWIAMGVNDTNGYAGSYDGTAVRIFEENDYDPEATTEAALQILSDFGKTCIRNPKYALSFYWRKINLQWNAPMYQCLEMNNKVEGEQGTWPRLFYEGSFGRYATEYMNVFQSTGYFLLLVLLIGAVKRKEKLDDYVGIIAILGGFCFTVIGENKARYAFPYFILMLPYFAAGIKRIANRIRMNHE